MSDSYPDYKQEEFQWSLHTIPVEVFLHICTFLDGKEIVETLKTVCRHFNDILSDDSVWRTWLKHRWPELPTSNICYKDDVIPSQKVCIQVDRGLKLWSKEESKIQNWVHDSLHISTVDTVKLIQGRFGVSGSRDRSLAVWDTADQLTLLEHKDNAHDGWIWDLATCQDNPSQLYSCSWDSSIKLWNLDQQLVEAASFKSKAAALTVVCRPGLVAAGLFTARVELFDPRSGPGPTSTYASHNRSVLALCLVRDFIVSASEDQTISVWDLTAGKVFKSGIQVDPSGHPMTLSFSEGNLLFVGDTRSQLHIFDTSDNSFQLLESFDLGHQPRGTITSMWHNPGFLVTGSKDSTARIHTATRPPHLINKLSSKSGGITALDFADPVLFLGCVNNAVEMWKP